MSLQGNLDQLEEIHEAVIAIAEVVIENIACEGHSDLSPQLNQSQVAGLLTASKVLSAHARDLVCGLMEINDCACVEKLSGGEQ